MIFWQLNSRSPQTVETLRAELERERDHFVRTHHPDTVVQQMNEALANSSGGGKEQISKALESYIAARPSPPQLRRAEEQMNGAIDGAVALATSMTRGLRNALVLVSMSGHVDENRVDGIDQRGSINIDFAPMPRMQRESLDEAAQ